MALRGKEVVNRSEKNGGEERRDGLVKTMTLPLHSLSDLLCLPVRFNLCCLLV